MTVDVASRHAGVDDARSWLKLERHGALPALVDPDGRRLTYLELAHEADRLASCLSCSPRGLVMLDVGHGFATIAAYLGALRAGHVVLVVDGDNLGLVQALRSTYQPNFESMGGAGEFVACDAPLARPMADDLALMLSTSGSSGSPKCVMLSYAGLKANALAIAQYLTLQASDRALLTLPLHYVYGLSVLHSHLAIGASLVTGQQSLARSETYRLIDRLAVTNFPTVPLSFDLLEQVGFRDQDHPSLRFVTQAGGRLDPAVVRRYAAWAQACGKRFYVMYGQTEAGPRISWLPPELAVTHPESMGVAVPGGAIDIVDERGQCVADGVVGELVYRGPNVMLGYATGPTDLATPVRPDRLVTGDFGFRNEGGLHFIVGRRSRFSKIYGKRLNLDEVEGWLRVEGHAAQVVSDDRKLYLIFEGTVPSAIACETISEQFDLAARDVVLLACPKWPTLASGKPDLQGLLSWARDEAVDVATPGHQGEGVSPRERLLTAYRRAFAGASISEQDSFLTLSGDSLNYVGLSIDIEAILGRLPDGWDRMSVGQLAALGAGPKDTTWAELEGSLLLRALAPLLVVMNHAGLTFFAGGAALLLALAGWTFAHFKWRQVAEGHGLEVLWGLAVSVVLPYLLLALPYMLLKDGFSIWELLLLNNNIGARAEPGFPTWFVHALVQMVLVYCLVGRIPKVAQAMQARPMRVVAGMLALAVGVRCIDGWTGWGEAQFGMQLSWVAWLFALGVAVAMARDARERFMVSVLVLLLPLTLYPGDLSRSTIITAGLLWVLWVPRVAVPRVVIPAVRVLGSASLFIYMLHSKAPIDSVTAGWTVDVVRIVGGVVLGVMAWWLYETVRPHVVASMRGRQAWRA